MSNYEPERPLAGKVALVTGATRGIGKGIALQLGEAGATVYITGRTLQSSNGMGSLEETANEIRNRGGICIPVQVDHEVDEQIDDLFRRIDTEQAGQLDILVNNAYKAVEAINETRKCKFWEMSPQMWDDINKVGLRNHYICTTYAARLMVVRRQGLIVNISSIGGLKYLFSVPYGVGKAGVDRMAIDCGKELKKFNVAMLSLYPGAVKTEHLRKIVSEQPHRFESFGKLKSSMSLSEMFDECESIEFAGKCVVSLARNPKIMSYTSRVIIAADYAQANGIRDIDGRVIPSLRQLNYVGRLILPKSMHRAVNLLPNWIKCPQIFLDFFLDLSKSNHRNSS